MIAVLVNYDLIFESILINRFFLLKSTCIALAYFLTRLVKKLPNLNVLCMVVKLLSLFWL